jgi:hypothetical protein
MLTFHYVTNSDGAGDGIQTRDLRLGKATLYQLSYSRNWLNEFNQAKGSK